MTSYERPPVLKDPEWWLLIPGSTAGFLKGMFEWVRNPSAGPPGGNPVLCIKSRLNIHVQTCVLDVDLQIWIFDH